MTYASFLFFWVVLPIGLVLAWSWRDWNARGVRALGLLLLVVYPVTSVWDNAAVAKGYWSFDPQALWGLVLVYLPLEEYLFFGLQSVLTGALVWRGLARTLPEYVQ